MKHFHAFDSIALLVVQMFLATAIFSQNQTVFYIQAHEDDWQLFMSQNILKNVSATSKAVFITLTAGDAGHGNNAFGNGAIPYFQAREKGAVYSTKFAVDITDAATESTPQATTVVVNSKDSLNQKSSHQISKYIYKNTVNYFLRLPDGHITGRGFSSTGNQSLQKLFQNAIKNLTAVDNSTTYADWTDLVSTLKAIVVAEAAANSDIWINCASLNTKFNPNDHSDHIFASTAIQEAIKNMPRAGIIEWADYNSKKMKHNLSKDFWENATALFGIYSWALCENRYASQFNNDHKQWLGMDYFSVKRIPRAENNATDSTSTKPRKVSQSIPLIVAFSNPIKQNEDINLLLSPYESGTLEVNIVNTSGAIVCANSYKVEKDRPANIQISQNLEPHSFYLIEILLNGKYSDSRKLIIN